MNLTLESHCKVNLVLNILGRREDGFHDLETLFWPVRLFDHLEFTDGAKGFELTCSDPTLPVDGQNLVHKAAMLFHERIGRPPAVRIHLEKRLPIAAGLGAGSANAAITLVGLNELLGRPLAEADLRGLAATLGSDVPFFLKRGPAVGEGRGERVTPVANPPDFGDAHMLLYHPGFGVSTPWAYKNLARFPNELNGVAGKVQAMVEFLAGGTVRGIQALLHNSLEAPVLAKHPILKIYQEFLASQGAAGVLMSGSGSTTFALFESGAAAQAAAARFREEFGPFGWLATTRF